MPPIRLKEMVVEISGRWRGRETDPKDWKNGRWWEYGFARRLELPEDANWTKMEAYITDDIFLEIRIPKNGSDIDPLAYLCKNIIEERFGCCIVLFSLWGALDLCSMIKLSTD